MLPGQPLSTFVESVFLSINNPWKITVFSWKLFLCAGTITRSVGLDKQRWNGPNRSWCATGAGWRDAEVGDGGSPKPVQRHGELRVIPPDHASRPTWTGFHGHLPRLAPAWQPRLCSILIACTQSTQTLWQICTEYSSDWNRFSQTFYIFSTIVQLCACRIWRWNIHLQGWPVLPLVKKTVLMSCQDTTMSMYT